MLPRSDLFIVPDAPSIDRIGKDCVNMGLMEQPPFGTERTLLKPDASDNVVVNPEYDGKEVPYYESDRTAGSEKADTGKEKGNFRKEKGVVRFGSYGFDRKGRSKESV